VEQINWEWDHVCMRARRENEESRADLGGVWAGRPWYL